MSELWITAGQPARMHCVLTTGKGPSGPVSGEALPDQLRHLEESGLFGGLVVDWNDDGAYVRLWSADDSQRAKFEERVSRARAKNAQELLGKAGQTRVARWRSDQAMAALKAEIAAAVAEGLPKRSAAVIADVNRLTVDDAVENHDHSQRPDTAQAPSESATPANTETAAKPSPAETARASAVPSTDLVRMKAGHTAACAICGTPANHELNGTPIHQGTCLGLLTERASDGSAEPLPAPKVPAPAQDPEPVATPTTQGAQAARRPARAPAKASSAAVRPAIVLDVDCVGLPDGTQVEHPFPVRGWADVAELAVHYGVGMLIGSWREDGQVWVTAAMLDQLGPRLDTSTDLDLSRLLKAYGDASKGAPELIEAVNAGWAIGRDTQPSLGRWSTMRRGSDKVRIALIPLMLSASQFADDEQIRKSDLPILAGNPTPGELAHRLAIFAAAYKHPYKVTPQTTALDYLQRFDYRGTNAQALFAPGTMPNLGTNDVELDGNFTRTPMEHERAHNYVHAYDRGASYPTGLSGGLKVGYGTPVHVPGPMTIIDKTYGFHLIANLPPINDIRDPHPLLPDVGRVPDGPFWRSTVSVAWAIERGYDVEILESWIWPDIHSAFGPWYTRIKEARDALLEVADDSVDHALALEQLKVVYTRFIGQMGSSSSKGQPGYAPDRRMAILARARVNLHRFIVNAGNATDRWPLAWDNDTILYSSDDPDPRSAFPGPDGKWGRGIGQLRWEGSALMEDHAKYLHGGPWAGKPALSRDWPPTT